MFALIRKVTGAALALGTAYFWGSYGFSYAWILLGLSAYAAQQYRVEERKHKHLIGKLLAKDEKAAVLARLQDLPAWVFFPDMERAEWLNKAIKQFWPYFGDYLEDMLKEIVEPRIRESLPSYLQSFRFDKIVTGDLPPRIGGVKVYQQVSRNEVVMDIELLYSGDCHFAIAVKSMRAGIKDLQLHGILRVIIKPLCKQMPLFGGMNFFFLNPPLLDFNLTRMADVFDIPGLSDMLHKAVIDNLCTWIVLPNKFPIVLSDEVSYKSLKFRIPSGVLRIYVMAAKDLIKADVGVLGMGKSDPYTILKVGAQEFKSPYINNTINPKWHYYCEAVVDQLHGQSINLEVMDHDQGNKDDFLGRQTLPIYPLASQGHADLWTTLEQVETGQLHLQTQWLSLSDNGDDLLEAENYVKQVPTKSKLSTSLLLLYIDSAQNLPDAPKTIVEPNPMVVVTIDGQKKQTYFCKNTNNPVWETNFQFLLRHPETKELHLEVLDSKSERSLGRLSIALSRLLSEPGLRLEEPFALRASGSLSKLTLTLDLKILKPDKASEKVCEIDDSRSDGSMADALGSETDLLLPPLDSSEVSEPKESLPNTPNHTSSVDSGINKDAGSIKRKESLKKKSPLSKRKHDAKSTPPPELVTKEEKTSLKESPTSPSSGGGIPSLEDMMHGTVAPILESADIKTNALENIGRLEEDDGTESAHGKVQLTLRHSIQRNKLVVVVHRATQLPMEDNDLPDPYVKLYLLPDRSRDRKQKTQICKNSCEPIFDEQFEFEVTKTDLASHTLEVIVTSKSGSVVFSRGKVLGKINIELANLDLSKAITEWYFLENKED